MPDTQTPFLDLVKPEISGSADTWGNKLNTDMDKIDTGVKTVHDTAGAALYRGRPLPDPDEETDEQKRTASQILLYADDVVFPTDRPGMLVSAKWVKDLLLAAFPIGTVIQWSGTADSIPTGWALCNGGTVNGHVTPNLTNRFLLGAQVGSGTSAPGMTGGVSTHQHAFTTDGTSLAQSQLPAVRPSVDATNATDAIIARVTSGGTLAITGGGPSDGYRAAALDPLGSGQPHNHTGVTGAQTNIPPYYAICFIMRVAAF